METKRLLELAGITNEHFENDDPIREMADIFEKLVKHEANKRDEGPEEYHEISSDIMNELHKMLRDRGLMS